MKPFPVTLEVMRAVAASFRAGAYRSADLYFSAAFSHQERVFGIPVDAIVRRAQKGLVRSIRRGLPGSRLKEAFDPRLLEPVVCLASARQPFDALVPHHVVDLLIVALWFMLREIELASASVAHLDVTDSEVAVVIPLRKTCAGGGAELARRSLRCPCRARALPLCPVHAAARHLSRLRALGPGFSAPGRRLFPSCLLYTSDAADEHRDVGFEGVGGSVK